MRDHSRRTLLALAAVALLAVAACGNGGPTSAPGATSTPAPTATEAISPGLPTPIPTDGATSTPAATVTPTTATEWGAIYDAIPAAFPRFPGSEGGEVSEGPASAVFAVPADVATVTAWYQQALETAAYSTLSLSGPFEDGSTIIESVGATPECLVQTTLRPENGSTIATILYGAGCPAPAG